MSIVVDSVYVQGREQQVIDTITKAVEADHVSVDNHLGLIAVVGRGMIRAAGTAARVFAAVARQNINLRMIDQGSSELNIIIGVDETSFDDAVRAIYTEFFHKEA